MRVTKGHGERQSGGWRAMVSGDAVGKPLPAWMACRGVRAGSWPWELCGWPGRIFLSHSFFVLVESSACSLCRSCAGHSSFGHPLRTPGLFRSMPAMGSASAQKTAAMHYGEDMIGWHRCDGSVLDQRQDRHSRIEINCKEMDRNN